MYFKECFFFFFFPAKILLLKRSIMLGHGAADMLKDLAAPDIFTIENLPMEF